MRERMRRERMRRERESEGVGKRVKNGREI